MQTGFGIEEEPCRFGSGCGDDNHIGSLNLEMIVSVEVGDSSGAAVFVCENFLHHTFGAQVAIAGGQSLGNHGVLRTVFCVDLAGEADTPTATHARTAAIVGHRIAKHGNVEGMEAEALCSGFQQAVFCVGRKRRHGQRLFPRGFEDVGGVIVARNTNLPGGFFVIRFEIVVGDGPVFESATGDGTVSGAHAKILFHEAPGHRAVAERAASDAGGIVVVGPTGGPNDFFVTVGIDDDAAIAIAVGAKGATQSGDALVAQIIFAAIEGGIPLATFEKDDRESGAGEFLGDDTATGASADDYRVDMFQSHDFLVSRLPRINPWALAIAAVPLLTAQKEDREARAFSN